MKTEDRFKKVNATRFKQQFGVIEEKIRELRKALIGLDETLYPIEYEWALRILWTSMAANDRNNLIRAIVAFYDEYVELRERDSPTMDDIDQLMTRWFGELEPRVAYYDETLAFEERVEKMCEEQTEKALSDFQTHVKRAARYESDNGVDSV